MSRIIGKAFCSCCSGSDEFWRVALLNQWTFVGKRAELDYSMGTVTVGLARPAAVRINGTLRPAAMTEGTITLA
jgi:hypothetical protein